MFAALVSLLSRFGATDCTPGYFFGLPSWYNYLSKGGYTYFNTLTQHCEIRDIPAPDVPEAGGLIALGIVDILFRVAAFVAVGYVIYGGIQFITAQGEADRVKKARQTIINSLIGLGITMISTGLVAFIGTRIGS